MRRVTLLALCTLLSFEQAFAPIILVNPRRALAAASASCATSDTVLPHDTLLEGFQGAGNENTWTSWVGTDVASFNSDYDTSSLTTGKPTGACNEGLQIDVGNTLGLESIYWDNGSSLSLLTTPIDVYFHIYIQTAPDEGEAFAVCLINNSANGTGSLCAQINMRTSGGVVQLQAEGSSSSAFGNLTASSWNAIKVHMDATALSSSLTINGGTPSTFTRTVTDFRYLHFGALEGHIANENAIFVIDLVTIEKP